ncbi:MULTISPECIES: cytochrome b/b6 domain-containing protein [unclassified Microbacterium]|uniref:cytochrome b/b6 domain-containing protein n=1 Tax=unclassified Microbacterium TaxID=2609290 RepID=UPI003465F7D5
MTESLGTAATDAPAAATPTADEIAVEGDGWPESDSVVPVEAYVVDVSTPIPFTRTAWAGIAASWHPTALAQPAPAVPLAERIRATPWTRKLSALIGALALLIVALAGVFLVRAVLSTDAMSDWLARYPGEYHLPESSSPGFPAWVQWQHFFNMFFMVLIIRTGLQVRAEKRPPVYWTPKWSKNGNGKISLALWLHQSLDILWLVNGILFVVLLFATNHWMRIVPTSWDVFPNALSALLQYVSLAWPTENGWVNYNSLQQIMYFLTVFVAAPLAAVTGVRMSGLWPKNAIKLSRAYPVEWARAVHFPVMVYFVVFIIIHVALVFATGVLRNLNHMYGGTDAVNWPGFLIFTGSMVLVIAGWIGARPLVLTPIAALTGKVSGR